MIPQFARRMGIAVTACLALLVVSPVLALNVQPVIIDLLSTGRSASAVISLQNTFAETVPVEVIARPVRIVDGELREIENEEAENILVFPAQATVKGGQTQAFRVQWVGDPAPTASEHYYVTVAQLPVALAENQNAIQVLHRFRVLVSVGAPNARPALKIVKAEIRPDEAGKPRPVISVANEGATYGYVGRGRMTIVQRSPAGEEIYRESFDPDQIQQRMGLGIVPSGATRVLPIGQVLPSDQGSLSVEITPVAAG
jgi:P pilus assembly chaperone PapD